MSFQEKVVLVTGGTSGIGRETAIQFAKAGAKVVLAGRRTEQGESVVSTIKADGGDAHFVQTDVTQEDQVERLVTATVERYGRLDIAFNNAGIELKEPKVVSSLRLFIQWGDLARRKRSLPLPFISPPTQLRSQQASLYQLTVASLRDDWLRRITPLANR